MHRIDSDGATESGLFTEGNASLSIPATVVSADIMNDMQEEIIKPIEAVGLTLVKGDRDQLYDALLELMKRGGRPSALSQAIANNQSSAADVTPFPLILTTEIIAIEFFYHVFRRTDSESVVEAGRVYVSWDEENSEWIVTKSGVHGDSETDFEMTTTGEADEFKLQYTTSNIAGASYSGTLKITDIKVITA